MPRPAALALLSLMVAALPAWALYDPKPDATLAAIEGEWNGSLTYRDYSDPDRIVTLSTDLFVTLGSPLELVMHYVYDDGPGKVVHSYETMRFDFEGGRVTWISGVKERTESTGRIVSDSRDGTTRRLVIESTDDGNVARHTYEFGAGQFGMRKDEIDAEGKSTFRDRYEFTRATR
jgi:hypothetical protein